MPLHSSLPTASGLSPRVTPGFVVYRGQKAGRDGLWKLAAEAQRQSSGMAPMGAWSPEPAIAPDGQRSRSWCRHSGAHPTVCDERRRDRARRVAEALDVRGAPAWSPDGQWLAVAVQCDGEPQLFKIPLDGGTPVPLVKEYSTDPTWSPSGQFLVYSGADVGTTFSVKAVSADGRPSLCRDLILTRGARRLAFLGDDTLVIMKGDSRIRSSGPSISRPVASGSSPCSAAVRHRRFRHLSGRP